MFKLCCLGVSGHSSDGELARNVIVTDYQPNVCKCRSVWWGGLCSAGVTVTHSIQIFTKLSSSWLFQTSSAELRFALYLKITTPTYPHTHPE